MAQFFKNYSLSIILAGLFLASWVAQGWFQAAEFSANAMQHRQEFQWAEFIAEFFSATFENWQSEFLQLLTFVVLTSKFIHKGSHESKDTDDEMMTLLQKIDKQTKPTGRR